MDLMDLMDTVGEFEEGEGRSPRTEEVLADIAALHAALTRQKPQSEPVLKWKHRGVRWTLTFDSAKLPWLLLATARIEQQTLSSDWSWLRGCPVWLPRGISARGVISICHPQLSQSARQAFLELLDNLHPSSALLHACLDL